MSSEDNKSQPPSCNFRDNKVRQHVIASLGNIVVKFDIIDAKLKYSPSSSDNLIVEEAVQELNSFLAQENMRLQELTDLLQEKHRTMSQEVLDQIGGWRFPLVCGDIDLNTECFEARLTVEIQFLY